MVDQTLLQKEPSTLGSWALVAAQAIDSYGLDSQQIFSKVGIDLADIKKPNSRLPTSAMVRVWQLAIELSEDPYIALRVAKFFSPSAFSALGMALATSENIYDALQRASRYSKIISDCSCTSLTENEHEVAFRVELKYAKQTQEYFPGVEAIFTCMFNLLRTMAGDSFNAKTLYFKHAFMGDIKPFEDFFDCPVYFSSPHNQMFFDKQHIFEKQLFSNSDLTLTLDEWVEDYLSKFNKVLISTQVKEYLLKHLAYGKIDLPYIASTLALSTRMLQRKLKEEGTSYSELLDECRQKMALKMIGHNKIPLAEVSYILGFSDQSNFSRAFKRWTGTSPNMFRLG